jgi:hypothetical protein
MHRDHQEEAQWPVLHLAGVDEDPADSHIVRGID